jgi:hypothetical protein
MDHSGWRALEAAGIEVERRQVRPEVDVQPLAPGRLGVPHGVADQRGGNALPLMVAGVSWRVLRPPDGTGRRAGG